jgi:threonine/homoserine/homoserine lactone efflux protein
MTFIIFILYGLSANGVRRYVVNSPRIITRLRRLFAGIFAALGIKLALIDQ